MKQSDVHLLLTAQNEDLARMLALHMERQLVSALLPISEWWELGSFSKLNAYQNLTKSVTKNKRTILRHENGLCK